MVSFGRQSCTSATTTRRLFCFRVLVHRKDDGRAALELVPPKKPHPGTRHKTPRIARDIELSVFSLIEYGAQRADRLPCLLVKFHNTPFPTEDPWMTGSDLDDVLNWAPPDRVNEIFPRNHLARAEGMP